MWQHPCPTSAPPWWPWHFMHSCHLTLLSIIPWLSPEFGSLLPLRLPTPVFWPGELHGLYSTWGHNESDMTEQLSQWKIFVCHISKQRVLHQAIILQLNPKAIQDEKAQDTGFRLLRHLSNEWFQWAQSFVSYIHRKVLNLLTWDVWFSLINSNLSMFWLPGLCCKTPI